MGPVLNWDSLNLHGGWYTHCRRRLPFGVPSLNPFGVHTILSFFFVTLMCFSNQFASFELEWYNNSQRTKRKISFDYIIYVPISRFFFNFRTIFHSFKNNPERYHVSTEYASSHKLMTCVHVRSLFSFILKYLQIYGYVFK